MLPWLIGEANIIKSRVPVLVLSGVEIAMIVILGHKGGDIITSGFESRRISGRYLKWYDVIRNDGQ